MSFVESGFLVVFLVGAAFGILALPTAVLAWIVYVIRRRRLPKRKTVLWEFVLVVGVPAFLTGGSWLGFRAVDPFQKQTFNRQAWLTATHTPDCVRGAMSTDLLDNHLRKGMTTAEVRQLLGEPDWGGGQPKEEATKLICYRYYLGNWSGEPMGGDYLEIDFDDAGRMLEAYRW